MFERFTDHVRQVLVLAEEEARMLNHLYIGTEHILLGLLRKGAAAATLASLGISLAAARRQVEDVVGLGKHAPTGQLELSPRAENVLELSLREALQLGHDVVDTRHILLGLIREGDGVGAIILVRLGVDLRSIRQKVVESSPPEAG